MKRLISAVFLCVCLWLCTSCATENKQPNIVATTTPVFTFTQALCQNTPLNVTQLVQENISCLHDYSLTAKHMMALENAGILVISGGDIEAFLNDALNTDTTIIDASTDIDLICAEQHEHHDDHHHDIDPHYWLSPQNGRKMAHSIYTQLKIQYPQYASHFEANIKLLDEKFDKLENFADTELSSLRCRKIITFHDGFTYMADSFGLEIIKSIEEESGSEASAKDLISICNLVTEHNLPAVFAEKNGSVGAAEVICRETGANLYHLDMGIASADYFETMYYNIKTLKEALG